MHRCRIKPAERPDPIELNASPSDAEWAALTGMLDFDLVEATHALDNGPPPASPREAIETRTRHTTIRIPADVLNAFRAEASRRRIGYQTLVVEALRSASALWLANSDESRRKLGEPTEPN